MGDMFEFGIRITADAQQLGAGAAEAGQQLDQVTAKAGLLDAGLGKLSGTSAKWIDNSSRWAASQSEVAATMASGTQETAKADTAASRYIDRMRLQYDSVGKSSSAVAALQAKMAGFDTATQKQAASIARETDMRRESLTVMAQQEQYLARLATMQSTAGQSWSGKELVKAEGLGFGVSQLANIKAQLKEIETANAAAGAAATRHGGEASAAMRAIGLETAAAKRELMVLGHEIISGNFSRIPGSLMVLSERTSLLKLATGLLTGSWIVAGVGIVAAIGAIAVAYNQGLEQSKAFNLGLAATSNYAGLTSSSMDKLVQSAHAATDISSGLAREVATQMVASGKLSGDVIAGLTSTVEGYAAASGKTAEQATTDLVRIFEDPSKGARELNSQMHFLTWTQIEHIDTLVKTGQTQQAQLELQKALYDHTGGIAVTNMGYLEKAWHGLTSAIKEGWDALQAWGRDSTTVDKLGEAQRELKSLEAAKAGAANYHGVDASTQVDEGRLSTLRKQISGLQQQKADEEKKAADAAETARKEETKIKGNDAWKQLVDDTRTWRQKLADETAKIRKIGADAGKSAAEIEAQIAATTAKLTPKSEGRVKKAKADPVESAYKQKELELGKAIAATNIDIRNIEQGITGEQGKQVAALEEWLKNGKHASELSAGQVANLREQAQLADQLSLKKKADTEYYDYMRSSAKQLLQTERDIASIRTSGQVNPYHAAADMRASFEAGGKNQDVQDAARQAEMVAQAAKKDAADMETLVARTAYGYDQQLDKLRQQQSLIGLSSREQEKLTALYQIEQDFKAKSVGLQGDELVALRRTTDEYRDGVIAAMNDRWQAETDWIAGAKQAMSDYGDANYRIADDTKGAFSRAFDGLGDVWSNFVKTGKLDFSGLVESAIADLAKLQLKMMALQFMESQGSGGGGGGGWMDSLVSIGGSMLSAYMGGGSEILSGDTGLSYSSAFSTASQSVAPGGSYDWFGGGRATGGPVSQGTFYEVNEKENELLTVGGRTYLMMGADDGHVTPTSAAPATKATDPATRLAASSQPAIDRTAATLAAAPAARLEVSPRLTGDRDKAGIAGAPAARFATLGQPGAERAQGAMTAAPAARFSGAQQTSGDHSPAFNIDVKVINQSSQQVDGKQAGSQFDGKKYVTSIILSDLKTNGPIRGAFQGLNNK